MNSELAGRRQKRLVAGDNDRKALHPRGNRLKQLRAFCQTARFGSISRAAEKLTWSQPSVSLQVSALEEELGLSLFERRRPHMTLSRAGESLYRFAMPLVQGMDRLPDTFAERHHGVMQNVLRIGAGQVSAMYLLPRFLEQFRQRYPEVRVDIKSGGGPDRLRWLRTYEIDLVIAAMDVPPPDLEFHSVLASGPMLITSLDHPLAGREVLSIEEAAAYPFVGPTPTHYARQAVETILRERGIVLDIVVEVDGWNVITKYVAAGVGISMVPDLCLTEHDRLWKIPITGVFRQRTYGAVTRRDGLLSLAERRLLRLMVADGSNRREWCKHGRRPAAHLPQARSPQAVADLLLRGAISELLRAALQLGISPPAVSSHVRELEHELEIKLFERSGSGVSLTSAGEALYALAEPLVEGMDALPDVLVESLNDSVSGWLALAATAVAASYVLPSYIKRFRDRFPGFGCG